jgi:predicted NAD-dependent protein-ADP-ribosyltransferase YbiA (DUF1768 family)
MDIGSGNGYPSAALSNFAPHPFVLDDVEINSMEGFLQSLKFKELDMQAHVCTLVGKKAKFKGKRKNWYVTQTLYWRGVEMKRDSTEYQLLLDRAYQAMAEQSDSFRKALVASGTGKLTHSMGKRKINETVLTTSEFCGRLMRIRSLYQK